MFRLLALVLVLAAPLGAQTTPKQAVAALKADGKQQLKLLKGAIQLAHQQFLLDVEETESLYLDGTFSWQNAVAVLFTHVAELQIEIQSQLQDALYETLNGAGVAALSDLGVDGDAFPPDLYFGQGGALDDLVASFHAAVDKELVAAGKRIKKTAKLLDKTDGVLLLWRLERPDLNDHYTVNESSCFTYGAEQTSIHTFVAASQRDAAGDGVLCLGGRGYTGTVDLSFGGGADFTDEALIDDATDSWQYISAGNIPEGNYVISASIEADVSSALANFGVP